MDVLRIGVMSDSFRLSPRDGVRKAAELGADGIQIYTVVGEMSPERLDETARKDFKNFCADLGLEISALCGDLGGHGFERADENPTKIECSKRIVDLAVDLGAKVVTTHIGVIPEDTCSEICDTLLAACRELGTYAEQAGVTFAIETGPEPAVRLQGFLDGIGSEGMGVNLDPANLVMVVGDDPVEAVHALKDYIVHTHAKDGVQLRTSDPAAVYNAFAEGTTAEFGVNDYFKEVPLGEGDVDWAAYLEALKAVGYSGFLTIEREVGENPEHDIALGIEFLRKHISREHDELMNA